jgi:uroporphyrinogen decarboxylase
MVPYDQLSAGAKKARDYYNMKSDASIYQAASWFISLDKWKAQGHISQSADRDELAKIFGWDSGGWYGLGNLSWSDPPFVPFFEKKILRDEGAYDVVQDKYGRELRLFKSHGNDFMPEYLRHPVEDIKTWEGQCLWRLDPKSPERNEGITRSIERAKKAEAAGEYINANMIGGFMYLRALIGTTNLLFFFYDKPDLIHRCMEAWFALSDSVCTRFQQEVSIDEVSMGEDVSYNHGALISPEMMKEFLFPYYQQLLSNIKARNKDKTKTIHFGVDTDGYIDKVIPLYMEIGMDRTFPIEVASGNDVIEIAKKYPELKLHGGIDKRILAMDREAIDREVDRIMPFMKKRGGYIPDCDHGVPENVSFENYLHYRRRILEFV